MACNSCSTGKDGKPGGCRGNGTCDTGGCNKLNVYNWLSEMSLPQGQKPFDILEVRFKGSRKEFYRNKELLDLKGGDVIAVESSPGHDVGVVSMTGELVRLQLKKKNITENSDTIKAVYRKAKSNEIEKWYEVKDKETNTLHRTREIIQLLKLNMKLSDVEFQGDGKKATFFYTADDRVDFRELIKKLADEFHVRVEMRQIGMRQEASRLGGIGVCGRELCCSTWLTDFKTVTTNTARYQNLALNPAKLAGQCGKLKCCLNYELDSYLDALRDLPATNIILETEKGKASHRKTDIFKRLMWYGYNLDERREPGETQEGGGGEGGNWIPLRVDRVKEIIELNKQSIKPPDLRGTEVEEEDDDVIPDYANVVGQDRIDRMDKKKKKKKKKKKPGSGHGDGRAPQQNAGRNQGGANEVSTPGAPPKQGGGQPNQPQRTGGQPNQPRRQGGQPNQPKPGGNQPNPPQQNQRNDQRKPRQGQGQPPRPQQNQPRPPREDNNTTNP